MSYIGREPQIGNFQMCDAISVVNGQAAYSMQVGGVAVIPGGNFNVIASVNGVVQKAGTSFTISSSTITFSQNLVTGDVIDFILILGSVLDLGVPSDDTVTTGKIADNAVTSAKLASGLALGKIGQVLQQEYATATASTSTSYADNGQTLAITPSATSSKILVMVETQIQIYGNGNNSNYGGRWKIVRTPSGGSAVDAFVNPDTMLRVLNGYTGNSYLMDRLNITHLDVPNTTDELTYKIQQRTTTTDIQITSQIGSGKSKLTLMEVLA